MDTFSSLNLIILSIWLISLTIALIGIRNNNFSGVERGLWALIVLAVPFLGVIAYLLLGARKQG